MPTPGRRLKEAREAARLTQEQVGKLFDPTISREAVSSWEADNSLPETKKLPILARAYKCSIDYLLGGRPSAKNEKELEIRSQVPLISWEMAGQSGGQLGVLAEGGDMAKTTSDVGPNAFALRVRGDSMEPRLPEGAVVFIDPDKKQESGSVILVKRAADQQVTLRQLRYDGTQPKLSPFNQRYPIVDMTPDTTIIGVAVKVELDL